MSAVVHFVEKDAVPAELRCGLCRNPWWADNALTCPECDEIFCRTCIEDHLLKLPTCPKCSQAVRLDALRKPPRQLRSMSERNIKVHCPNARHCWQGPWGELSAHVAECPRNPAKYVYVGAADDDLVCEICHEPAMQPLAASCCEQIYCSRCIRLALSREERCPHCRAHQTEDVLAEPSRKIVSLLDALQVRCNAQCGWVGPRAELERHRDACPERVVVGGAAAAAAPRAGPVVVAAIPATPAATVADVAAPPAAPPAAPAGGDKPARHVAFAPAAATAAAAVAAPTTGSTHVTVAAKSYHPQLTASSRPVTCTTMAHLTAPQPTAAMSARRKDLHISAAMDISGSMRGDKLRLAKEALAFVVDELQPTDKFGLIAFDDQVEEVCPSLDMTAAGKQSALTHVRSLRDRGSTNLSGGLFAAVAQARDIAVTSAGHTIAAAAGNCRSTRRAAQPHMGPATAAHADPAATAAAGGSWMSRSISRVASVFGSSSSSALPPASASYGSAAAPARVPPPAAVVPLPTYFDAFKLTLAVNASPMKQDGKWLARYSFEIDERLPAGVSSVSVGYGPVGNIVVRGRSTFPLIEDQEPVFTVQVFRDGLRGEPHAEFRFHVRADDEPRKHSFDVPAFAAPTAPTRDAARERSRIVLLFTDGQANAGIIDPTTLVARTREVLASLPDKDVTIFTFGFGAGHNGTLLQQLAEVSQGSYYFVERADQIKEIFADCIGGLLSMVATNVRLVVRPAFGVRLRAVLTSFPQAANPDGSITVSIKDLYAEEQRDVLVEAEVAPRSLGPAAPVVSFALTCDNVVLGRAQAAEAVCALPTVAEEFTGTPDLDVDQQLSRHRAAEAMAEAQKFADLGEVAKANAAVRECRSQLAVAPSASAAYSQQLQRDLAVAERATSDAAVWRSEGQKQVSRMKSSHAMQRSNNVGDEADDMDTYSTAAKVASRRKARAS